VLARQLRSAREQRRLARLIEDEVNRLNLKPTLLVRKMALDYGRMVWKALMLTGEDPGQKPEPADTAGRVTGTGKRKRGRPRKTREQRLADVEARMKKLGPGILSARAYRQLRKKVEWLYEVTCPRLTGT